jgi:hypothetical protein
MIARLRAALEDRKAANTERVCPPVSPESCGETETPVRACVSLRICHISIAFVTNVLNSTTITCTVVDTIPSFRIAY